MQYILRCVLSWHSQVIFQLQVNAVNSTYYETIDSLEKQGVDREYIQGWAGGFLSNPMREEQRLTQAYEAGYADGSGKHTDNATSYVLQ